MSNERWYFTKEQLENSPSRRCGFDADKELSHRQQAANFIQDMGQRLQVTQLCINTAIVYMHRFYVFHSFSQFHRNAIATAALFLAAKVEEQPRKLEHIIKVAQICLQKGNANTDRRSEVYLEQVQELVINENILLQTLGFDVAIEHPHTFIVNFCHLAKASKDLSQTSYFMASNSLHLTTMCLQYKPTVVACFCIHLVCKWSNWQIPKSKENLSWYSYIDPTVTQELLEQLTNEFLVIFDKCPSRLKKKIQNTQNALTNQNSLSEYPVDPVDSRKPNANSHSSSGVNAPSYMAQQKYDNSTGPGPSRSSANVESKKSSMAFSSNYPQNVHSPTAKPNVTHLGSGFSNSMAAGGHENVPNKLPSNSQSQALRTNSNHVGAPQQQPQQPQVPMSLSSHHPHKTSVTNSSAHNIINTAKPRIHPSSNHSAMMAQQLKDASRMEQRKPEIKQEPGLVPAAASLNSHYSKNHYNIKKESNSHQDNGGARFVPSSQTDIISNVVKEVALAKQKEKIVIKGEPEDEKPFVAGPVKAQKNHSIFSPSPVGPEDRLKSPLIDERMLTDIAMKSNPTEAPKSRSRVHRSNACESEIASLMKQEVIAFDDMIRLKVVPLMSPKREPVEKERNSLAAATSSFAVNTLAVSFVPVEEPSFETKVENLEYSKIAAPGGPSASCSNQLANHSEEHVNHDKTDASAVDCMTHPHKKKKKHKEKDKRHDKEKRHHKEKKRHKEDKHHHRKEHHREKDAVREPGPIKITIPKEKLVDIPMKLKIKINKDQIVPTPVKEDSNPEPAPNDFKLKISKDVLKTSRKRERDSDSDQSSKKFAYGNSHNGYREYRT